MQECINIGKLFTVLKKEIQRMTTSTEQVQSLVVFIVRQPVLDTALSKICSNKIRLLEASHG